MNVPERLDHRFLNRISRGLYAGRTGSLPDRMPPERLLIVRVDERVGNLIAMQSMIDTIRQSEPGIMLGLWTTDRLSTVTESLIGINRLHRLDKRWFFRHPLRWHRAVREVRDVGYQVAIDASAWHAFSYTHAALAYYSGAPVRIGYQRGNACGFHTLSVPPGSPGEYEGLQRRRLLEPVGLGAEPVRLRTGLGMDRVETWRTWLADHRVERPIIGVWAGSRKINRRWPIAFFVKTCRLLQEQTGANIVILWGPGEEALRDELVFGLPQGAVVAPGTDLNALAGLLRNLDLVIINDTGPMHLSVAAGTRTLAVFTMPEHTRWGHPYPDVCNLHLPGRNPSEVGQAVAAARGLLSNGTPPAG